MEKKSRKKAAKSRADDDEVVTITLSGEALRRATDYGGGDPSKGVDLIMRSVVELSAEVDGELFEYPAPAWTNREPEGTDTSVRGFGVKADIDIAVTSEVMAKVVGNTLGTAIHDAGSAEITTPEMVADLSAMATACITDRLLEFWEIVAAKFAGDLWDTFGDATAAVLSDVFDRMPGYTRFSIEQRKQLVQKIRSEVEQRKNADDTLRIRPFSRMRGGVSDSRLLKPLTPEQLAAYGALVQRVTPTWKAITAMRNSDRHGWTPDAKDHAARNFTGEELAACLNVIERIPSSANSLNSARIGPAVCAREHARIVLDISKRSDDQLKKLQTIEG